MKRNGWRGTCEEEGLKRKRWGGMADEDWVKSKGWIGMDEEQMKKTGQRGIFEVARTVLTG